jgi:tRNA G18 (ribose-2'-O)-methylase SpoU
VSAGIRQVARTSVAVPLARGAESLNVAVAAGIVLFEVGRGA